MQSPVGCADRNRSADGRSNQELHLIGVSRAWLYWLIRDFRQETPVFQVFPKSRKCRGGNCNCCVTCRC